MEKAYDPKELGAIIVAKAKENGLTIAEDALETLGRAVYYGTRQWLKESAALTTNPVDNMIEPLISVLDPIIEQRISAIDVDGDGR